MEKKPLDTKEINYIGRAFAYEAVHKLLSDTSKEGMLNNDLLYQLFSHNRDDFASVREEILKALLHFQEWTRIEADQAFEQISVKYSQHRD